MIEELNLWAAQDALLAALGEQPGLAGVPCEIGFPASIQPDHVWIDGAASGSLGNSLSGATSPSDETFRLTVIVYTQRGDEYAAVRDRLKGFAGAVEDALASPTFAAVVPAWSVPAYNLDAGTDGTHRQLSLELIVECRCW